MSFSLLIQGQSCNGWSEDAAYRMISCSQCVGEKGKMDLSGISDICV